MKRLLAFSLALFTWQFVLAQAPQITCPPTLTVQLDPGTCVATIMSDLSATSSDHYAQICQTDGIVPPRELWAWGGDYTGQVGDGSLLIDQINPVHIGTQTDWKKVAAGYEFSLGIRSDGTLWAWGNDFSGQLGDGGSNVDQAEPVQVGTYNDWVTVEGGSNHALGIRADGSLWAWGYDSEGQLGDGGSNTSQNVPTKIGIHTDWVAVAGGIEHSLGIRADGTLWAWGSDGSGQLGNGAVNTSQNSPIQVGSASNWVSITAGSRHSLGIQADGTLWAWGTNTFGMLGIGSNVVSQNTPIQVGTANNWAFVTASNEHTLAIKTDGTLWAWGRAIEGQLGDGGVSSSQNSPIQVGTNTDWVTCAAGSQYSLGIRANGTLWAWGVDGPTQLLVVGGNQPGQGTLPQVVGATQIGTSTDWSAIASGGFHYLGIQQRNEFPQGVHLQTFEARIPGGNSATCSFTLTVEDLEAPSITCPPDITVSLDPGDCMATLHSDVSVSSSDNCSYVVNKQIPAGVQSVGSLWAWGNGVFGNGIANSSESSPIKIGTDSSWISVSAGTLHSLGIRADGTLWAWGQNTYGQLGIGGTNINQLSPVQVGQANDWVQVSAGQGHSLGIRSDGSLWAWGRDQLGQLGDGGADSDRDIPVQVGGFIDWISIEAGNTCSFGIRSNGTLWAWGANTAGVLGIESVVKQRTPLQIGSDSDWLSISTGRGSHCLALKSSGTLWAWGDNIKGQLGIGSIVGQENSPVQVGLNGNWIAISAGDKFSLGVQSDGTLWAWGTNNLGQLGLGFGGGQETAPVQVGSATDWIKISGATNHSIGLKADGSLWTWGRLFGSSAGVNIPTQLGNGLNWECTDAFNAFALALQHDGFRFPVGIHTLSYMAIDPSGNTDACSFMVTVEDMTNPIAICQNLTLSLDANGDLTVDANSVDNGSYDDCGSVSFSLSPNTFDCNDMAANPHTVVLTVSDNNGNQASCMANVTVEDNTNPVAICQDVTITLDATGNASVAAISLDNGSNDVCSHVTLSSSRNTFDCNDIATSPHTVTLTAEDNSGNQATCTAHVEVQDNIRPSISCPSNAVLVSDPGVCGASYTIPLPTASDNCSIIETEFRVRESDANGTNGQVIIANTSFNQNHVYLPEARFYEIRWRVTDQGENRKSCHFLVEVQDTESPAAVCQNVTIALDQNGEAFIEGSNVGSSSSDNCGISTYGLSVNTFSCAAIAAPVSVDLTVKDASENLSSCQVSVTVKDLISPSFLCPTTTLRRDADAGNCTHIVNGDDLDPDVSDNCQFTLTNDLTGTATLANTVLPIGRTSLNWTATDASGNSSTCSYDVRIRDREAPLFTNCPPGTTLTVPFGAGGAYHTWAALTATDNCNSPNQLTISGFPLSGSFFPIGTTTVNWTVEDRRGNTSACMFDITVEEQGAPVPNGWAISAVGNTSSCATNWNPTTGHLRIESGGGGVGAFSDNFCSIHIPSSDAVIDFRARVTPPGNGYYDQAGIMMRQNIAANEKHATMMLTGTGIPIMAFRVVAGSNTFSSSRPAVSKPYWLRLYRAGATVTGYISPDGSTWAMVTSSAIFFSNPLDLVLFSATSGPSGQATFDHISINGVAARLGDTSQGMDLSLNAFPNPFNANLAIKLKNALPEATYQLSLLNMLGQEVYAEAVTASAEGKIEKRISLAELPAGTYLLEVSAGVQRQAIKVQKF